MPVSRMFPAKVRLNSRRRPARCADSAGSGIDSRHAGHGTTALASIRAQLPVDDGPIGVLGGSLGGAVALRVLADAGIPVAAAAVVNAAIRMRSVVDLLSDDYRRQARWTPA
ncbi:hypothetical protein SAMN04489718_1154 [Actinopolyspora saharensis]|uniref:Alpha/beta hydrolase family protein n=1 Tax=Actinopolyspora saharensis TaxID=995062 RepID=A0A1H0ZNF4_9ACTN|nr:hypothetical protein SAMN04489718_1154 [Actinopolyspora saharensis]